jgi:hypothetical protein
MNRDELLRAELAILDRRLQNEKSLRAEGAQREGEANGDRILREKAARSMSVETNARREIELAAALRATLDCLFDIGSQVELREMVTRPHLTAPLRESLMRRLLTDEEAKEKWATVWEAGTILLGPIRGPFEGIP